MTDMPTSQTSIQLYSCADESVQNAIINTYPKFFTTDPDKLLEMIVALVTQKSNPKVHQIIFASMSQQGFPRTCNLTAPRVNEYWEVRLRSNTDNGLVLLDQRIVIPITQRKKKCCTFYILHTKA